ncbi:UNKNOWN [Stylonychia lemnae]|uniref:Uncharacterized protein n=1 Tax=Stylonychia lemnae TaxID=5949 RepID=A0A078AAU1_STYLE|nr:UNKNOWN [Stylonychia lemnae]|eukprot:CDW78966.1 UNKNOWN [Stylonychia lemnae]
MRKFFNQTRGKLQVGKTVQNINENSYRNDNQLNQSANHSHVPSNSGLYQQIRSKNNNSVLVQSQQNGLIQYSINNNNNAHQSQIQIKDYRASVDNVLSQNNNNNIIQQSNPGNGLNISQDSNRKSALIRYQQQFSSQKRSSIKAESSGKNSIKNNGGSKGDSFFSSRVNASMGASKDNLKQVIKIYKEGLRADGEVSNTNGYQSNRISQNAKDSNSKGSLISNVRNMSVPRAANQPSKFMISSQDYSGIAGNINNNNAYYSTDKTNVKDKGQLNRNEALNSSIGNMKLTDAYGLNETEDYSRSKFTETTPMTQNGVMNSNTKHHSILQGTLRHCNCPCNCQSNQQDTQSQTTNNHNMMSILSGNNKKNNYNINNTMTLRIGHALNTTTGHQTTTVMIDEPNVEATNIEDMHILLVNVEKIKRKMLGKTEGQLDPVIDYRAQLKYQQDIEEQNQQKGNNRDDFSIELHNTSGLNVIIYE